MRVAKGLCKPRCPGTYLLFASWLQGMREGARYRMKWQGSVPASSKTPQV